MTTSVYPKTVDPGLGEAFASVVYTARGLSAVQRRQLQRRYEAEWTEAVEDAGERTHDALVEAGLSTNFDEDPAKAWIYLDELCGIVGGSADVAQAVLLRGRGLISNEDFKVLTGWWVAAGLKLPYATC
jgi:hypothetical protein